VLRKCDFSLFTLLFPTRKDLEFYLSINEVYKLVIAGLSVSHYIGKKIPLVFLLLYFCVAGQDNKAHKFYLKSEKYLEKQNYKKAIIFIIIIC